MADNDFIPEPDAKPFQPENSDFVSEPGAKPFEKRDVSFSEALGRGAAQGLTFGFSDELRALGEAGGLKPEEPASLSALAKGVYKYWTEDPEAVKRYEEAKARESKAFEEAKKQRPYTTMAGEIAGAIPTMALLPGGQAAVGAKLGERTLRGAIAGAEYGALAGAGEGEGLEGRLKGAGVGAVTGGLGGGAAPAVISGIGQVGKSLVGRPISVAYGWLYPEAAAANRFTNALTKDMADIYAGKAQGMSLRDWQMARAAGEPVTLADLGASNTQALLRSAANTSPEARNLLEKVINERFEGQAERVATDIRQLITGGANRFKTADQLEAEYRRSAKPLYDAAYANPRGQMLWDEGFQQLSSAPVVQQAMKDAVLTGANKAAIEGFTPIKNPFSITQEGRMVLSGEAHPNIQFWDYVKRNLDDTISALYRSGQKNAGNDAKSLRDYLLTRLDDLVPEYKAARGVAADYFGASNALEAGSVAATKKMAPEEVNRLMRAMKPEERELFREGWASTWSDKILSMRDRVDVSSKILGSPQERRIAEIVFGSGNLGKVEARIELERIMDGARRALGNSTTARQLIEAGLAGGAGGLLGSSVGQEGALAGAVSGAFAMRAHPGQVISKAIGYGAGYVDKGTARRVAELLMSDDPNVLAEGFKQAAKNKRIMDGLKAIADRVSIAAASQSTRPEIPQITITPREQPRSTGGSVLSKMHAAKRRAEGGPTDDDVPFDEPGIKRTPEGYPYIQADDIVQKVVQPDVSTPADSPEEPRPGYLQKSFEGLTRGVRELPGAVARAAEDYWAKTKEEQKHGLEMAGRGISNIAGGQPATGVGELGLGALQYLVSPISGVQKPVEKATGSPEFAERLMTIPLGPESLAAKTGIAMAGAGTSAKGVLGAMQAAKAERELSPLGFYSHGVEVAAQLPQAKGTPEQMRAMLERAGVKPAELEGFTEAFAGKPSVTREEVAQHFKQAMPQVEESVLGGGDKMTDTQFANRYDELYDQYIAERGHPPRHDGILREWADENNAPKFKEQEPKFQQYTLPGGENYREVLLKLPTKMQREAKAKGFSPEAVAEYTDVTPGVDFRSSHWGEPNVLAHLRMSDRTGPNGEKMLHVEEMQSDWGQKGRKEGFIDEKTTALNAAKKEYESLVFRFVHNPRSFTQGDRARIEELRPIVSGQGRQSPGVPSAPYVTSTQGWTDLALKRVLKEAADGGYDGVVFTPGAQQAARYDLSKHVDSLLYKKNPDGTYQVSAQVQGRGQILGNGKLTKEELSNYVGKEVAERIVKEEGKRTEISGKYDPVSMTSSKDYMNELSGEGLKVGGEGMRSYYDKIVPTQLDKLVRKYDKSAKLKLHDMELPTPEGAPTKGHTLMLTPAIRDAVKGGLPAFERGGSVFDKMRRANGGEVDDPFERAAQRQRNAVISHYGRQEGPFTGVLNKAVPAVGNALLNMVTFPGRYARGETGYVPGQMAAEQPKATDWTADTAMNMVGTPALTGGVPRGALGSAGGRGILGNMARPSEAADKFERSLRRSGMSPGERHGSQLSSSHYIETTIPDWRGYSVGPLPEDATRQIKVRFSDHELPPTYGQKSGYTDIEVGPHASAVGDWREAIKWLLDTAGVKPDPKTASIITKYERKIAAEKTARETAEAAARANIEHKLKAAEENWNALKLEFGAPDTLSMPAGVWNPKTQRKWMEGFKSRNWQR